MGGCDGKRSQILFNQFDINDNALAGMTLKSAGNFSGK